MSKEINYNDFWKKLADNWNDLYISIINNTNKEDKLKDALYLINILLGEELQKYIDIEFTVCEINRIYYDKYDGIIELYISPRLKKENIIYMEKLYNSYIEHKEKKTDIYKKLNNLTVVKYKAYNIKDSLIEDITYDNYVVKYEDIGVQTFIGYDEKKMPVLNLVLYVKNIISEKILKKKKIKVIMQDGSNTEIEKWLPHETNAFDIFLLNVIGEYNFINNIGYIEFLPEGDPLIAEGSIFTELNDIKKEILLLEKIKNINICSVCGRRDLQKNILMCAKCKNSKYCGFHCQSIDYKSHKYFC